MAENNIEGSFDLPDLKGQISEPVNNSHWNGIENLPALHKMKTDPLKQPVAL